MTGLLSAALDAALGLALLAMALTSWRLLRGPTLTDRVLAVDTLYVNVVGLMVLLGLRLGSELLFEAALLIALLGFVGTVALSRFVARGDVIE